MFLNDQDDYVSGAKMILPMRNIESLKNIFWNPHPLTKINSASNFSPSRRTRIPNSFAVLRRRAPGLIRGESTHFLGGGKLKTCAH